MDEPDLTSAEIKDYVLKEHGYVLTPTENREQKQSIYGLESFYIKMDIFEMYRKCL